MLVIVAMGWAITQTGRFLLPPLLPVIMEEVGISVLIAGVVLTIMQVVYAIAQYPSGKLSDWSGRPIIIIPGMVLIGLSFFIIAGITTTFMLVFAVVLLGLGRAMYNVPSRALISDLYTGRRGRAMGIFTAGSDLGGIFAGILSIVLAMVYLVLVEGVPNWRIIMGICGIASFVLIGAFVGINREKYKWDWEIAEKVTSSVRGDVMYIVGERGQRETILAFALFIFVATAMVNFLPLYLIEGKDFELEIAGSIFGWFFLLGMVVKPIIGALSDRAPRYLISIGGLFVSAGGVGLLIIMESVVGVMVAIAIFAIGYKGQFPVIDAILMDSAPKDSTGSHIGAARSIFFTLGGLGAAYMGFAIQNYSYTVGMIGLGVALLLAALLLIRNYQN
ncbi:MAG: MFS transporter [Halobacteriales archaeon]|nr:MFS transporter [Halobacteriales archaeon]